MTSQPLLSAAELEQRIRAGIPITEQMAFQVSKLTAESIAVVGGSSENINVHGTAFAGSLYTIATLALWGLVYARLPDGATLVLSEGNIRYLQPVIGEIVADCSIPKERLDHFLLQLHQRGRARLDATVQIPGLEGPAVEFSGKVHARLKHEQ
jgi:thioesterase domain-containing protein